MKTPHVQAIVDDVEDRFDGIRIGAWACRRIAGLTTWSQHAYTEGKYEGNAADIFPWSMEQGDQIAAYLRHSYPETIKVVLWRVKNHFDHVHFDTWPTGIGTPPCKGGKLRVMHRDGRIGRTFKVPTPSIDEMVLKQGDVGDAVKVFQKSLNNWNPDVKITVDGVYGSSTTSGVKSYQHAADIDQTGVIDGVTAALLIRYV